MLKLFVEKLLHIFHGLVAVDHTVVAGVDDEDDRAT